MRTFLFTRPRGNSLYFLHGELLRQGVFRAALLASAKTHKKLRPRKQRTYRRSSLRGEFQLILFSSFAANCLARSGSLTFLFNIRPAPSTHERAGYSPDPSTKRQDFTAS